MVGWGGLNRDPKAPQWGVEVAYFFDPSYWGRGLASELVQESLSHAFRDLGLDRVGAFVRPENHASIRVLVKAGFGRVRDAFQMTAAAWGAPVLSAIELERALVDLAPAEARAPRDLR